MFVASLRQHSHYKHWQEAGKVSDSGKLFTNEEREEEEEEEA